MVRKLPLLAGLVLMVSLTARAQDKIELFGGYSYQRVDASPSFNLNGWEFSGEYKTARWLGFTADFDGHYGSTGGLSTSTHHYLFGPQVSWPTRVSPFAHVLFGGGHIDLGGVGDSSFSTGFGGGIDTELLPNVYWRVIEGDYIYTHFFGSTQHNGRLSTGIVIHF